MLWWFAQTTIVAAGLAAVASLAGRWRRVGPEARHALWLLVLLKLLMPPLVGWSWSVPARFAASDRPALALIRDQVPDPGGPGVRRDLVAGAPLAEATAIEAEPSEAEDRPVTVESPPDDPTPTRVDPDASGRAAAPARVVLPLWWLGTVAVVGWELARIVRFGRTLRQGVPAPAWLDGEIEAVALRFGVRPPPARVVVGLRSPLLWCVGRPWLYLPWTLLQNLPPDRRRGVLAHEMAHLARRDHWVARLELAAEALWWWNPLFWAVRRRLRDEAERACDARVVRAWPEARLSYAEALVDVCERLSRPAMPSPALGVGGGSGQARSLERRLSMILGDPVTPPNPIRATLALALLAALTLPAWTLAQQQPAPPPDAPTTPAPAPALAPAPAPAPAPPLVDMGTSEVQVPVASVQDSGTATYQEMQRRVLADPEVVELGEQLLEAQADLAEILKFATLPDDPARRKAERKLRSLEAAYERLGNIKAQALRAPVPPLPSVPTPDETQIQRDIERQFLADPEVIALVDQMIQMQDLLKGVRAHTVDKNDPVLRRIDLEFQKLKSRYDQLWKTRSAIIREQRVAPAREAAFDAATFKARRDGKAAELRKAEAVRDGARAALESTRKMVAKNVISGNEMARYEVDLRVAEAEVDAKKAALEEAEVALRRAISLARGAWPEDAPARSVTSRASANAAPVGENPTTLQARRKTLAAELEAAEAARSRAASYAREELPSRNLVSGEERARAEAAFKVADAERDRKQAALAEIDEALRRATPRPDAALARGDAADAREVAARPSLADLRDAVELLEAQLQARQREPVEAERALVEEAAQIEEMRKGNQPEARVQKAQDRLDEEVRRTRDRLAQGKADIPEAELRLKQAKRRVEAEEVRVRRDAERAKSRLDWATKMLTQGYLSAAEFDKTRDRYDDLMFQLDPGHKPTPTRAAPEKAKPSDPPATTPEPPKTTMRDFSFAIGMLW